MTKIKNVYIIGAGGCGREVYHILKAMPEYNKEWVIKGFLDDNPNALKNINYEIKVVGSINGAKIVPENIFVLAIGNCIIKERIVKDIKSNGGRFLSAIHPTATIFNNAVIGEGAIIYPNAVISDSVIIGDFVLINCNSSIGHNVEIGDYSIICSQCDLTGYVHIGEKCYVSSSVKFVPKSCLGNHVFVGIGSVVIGKIKEGLRVMGNPATKMKI